ncbi:MAG: prepilin-type N-terminal cleavage/methylation domain-containing protein [Phycisphaerales bacterium]
MIVLARTIRRGFTAVELIVGIIIISLLAGATATSMSRLVSARTAVQSKRQAFARAADAANRMALDVENAVRDADLLQCKIEIVDKGAGAAARDELLVLMKSLRPARGLFTTTGFAEGDEYESQYRLEVAPGKRSVAGGTLMHRLDPALDGFVDGGGVAGPVADGIESLSIEAYDGEKWYASWDSDKDGLPHAVRVIVVGLSDDGKRDATVRRVIAIDRVPLPPETEEGESSGEASSDSGASDGGSGGSGGTGGGS